MKRNLISYALIISAIMLTGCSGNNEPTSSDNSTASQNSSVTENATSAATAEASVPESGVTSEAALPTVTLQCPLDLDGTTLDLSKLDYSSYGGARYYVFHGFAWFAHPTGKAVVTTDGTELQPIEYTLPEFTRREVGNQFDGLTLISADTEVDITDDGESFFNGCSAVFEGTSEITGYAFIQQEEDYMMPKGTIFFMPEEGGCSLPVIYTAYSTLTTPMFYNDIGWGNEYNRQFDLGNISDYADAEWLSQLPADGTPVRITATVSDIKMSCYRDSHKSGNGWLSCSIDSLELA